MRGWVYIISNKAMPGLLNIGSSMKDPEFRAMEQNTIGDAAEYNVIYEILVDDPEEVIKNAYRLLNEFHQNKEWFEVEPSVASLKIKEAVGNALIYLENIKHPEWFHTASIDYGNGWTYKGPILNGKASGIGKISHEIGAEVFGLFKEGELEEGTKVYENGAKYVGSLNNFQANGVGFITFGSQNGADFKYHGEFKDDQRHGEGTTITFDKHNELLPQEVPDTERKKNHFREFGKYENNQIMDGIREWHDENGTFWKFKGRFERGQCRNGILTSDAGYHYEGNLTDGQPVGKGVFSHRNQHNEATLELHGEFINGLLCGRGIKIERRFFGKRKSIGISNSQRYCLTQVTKGCFENGREQGICTVTTDPKFDGQESLTEKQKIYEGPFIAGKRHGKGINEYGKTVTYEKGALKTKRRLFKSNI